MKIERSTPLNLNSQFLGPAAPGLKQAGPPRAKAAAENAAKNAVREAEGKEPQSIKLDDVRPEPKAQRHFTDPDSKIRQTSNKGWDQCGNAQALVVTRSAGTVGWA